MADRVLLDLRLLPRWELISELRRLVARALERLNVDPDHAYCASLATHELLENAVKYGRGEVRVRIHLDPKEKTVRKVEVENKTTRAQVVKLKRVLSTLAAAEDPMQAYTSLMGARLDGGGLGLARVAAEGDMALACASRRDHVAVTASMRSPRV